MDLMSLFQFLSGGPGYDPNEQDPDYVENSTKYYEHNLKSQLSAIDPEIESKHVGSRLLEMLDPYNQAKNHDPFTPTENIGPPSFSTSGGYTGEPDHDLAYYLVSNALVPNSSVLVDAINQITQAGGINKFKNRDPLSIPYGPIYLNKNGMGLKESKNLFEWLIEKQQHEDAPRVMR